MDICSMPARPWKGVSFVDKTGKTVHAPLCSVCQKRIPVFIIDDAGICETCSAAGKDFPVDQEDPGGRAKKPDRPHKGTSIIDFPDEYVCIDVETTGRSLEDEIIEVAALRVRNGQPLEKFTSLIKPLRQHVPLPYEEIEKLGYTSFSDVPYEVFEDFARRRMVPAQIEKLTGITDKMLLDAPTADVVIPQLYEFVGGSILVGHNVDFDVNFLYDACQCCGLSLRNDYVDTLRIARNLFPEWEHYRLGDLAKNLDVKQNTAHRAEADAVVTSGCLEAMKQVVLQDRTISEYIRDFVDPDMKGRISRSRTLKSAYAKKSLHPSELVRPDRAAPSHPLYGKTVVFTGDLSIARAEAAQMAVDVGAIVKTAVSRKTDFLVVGHQDIALVGSSGVSSKEKKAQEVNDSGKGNVQILSEKEFLDLVEMKEKEGVL